MYELCDLVRVFAPNFATAHANPALLNRMSVITPLNALDMLDEIREYDVPYYMRAAIDLNIRVGAWHTVSPDAAKGGGDEDAADGADVAGAFQAVWQQDVIEKPAPRVW